MRRPKRWVVRLGYLRGAGKYLTCEASVVSPRMWGVRARHTSARQRDARRFNYRAAAVVMASEYGGRVVRLKPRGAK